MLRSLNIRLALSFIGLAAASAAAAVLIWPGSTLPVTFSAVAISLAAVLLARFHIRALQLVERALRRSSDAADLDALERAAELEPQQLGLVVGRMLERQRAQLAEEAQRRDQLSVILEGMAEGVIAVDPSETVLRINAAGLRMLAITIDPHRRKVWEVTRSAPVIEVLRSALRARRQATGELVLRNGIHEQYLDLTATPLLSELQELTGAVLVLHDVTQVRRLEQVRRDFVANVGHELKTPLTAIHALVETVRDDGAMDDATRRDFLNRTLAQSQRLQALIADLLLLSRVESQEEPLQHERVDLRRVLRDSLSSLTPAAEARQIELVTAEGDAPAYMLGNSELLRQALSNLIDNAIKYTPAGGRVEVRIGSANGRITVSVADNGPGIPAEHLDRIFERFYRVDKARSREVGGTGLGLAIVKHIALLHQGSVKVESKPGFGSRFSLGFPDPDTPEQET